MKSFSQRALSFCKRAKEIDKQERFLAIAREHVVLTSIGL